MVEIRPVDYFAFRALFTQMVRLAESSILSNQAHKRRQVETLRACATPFQNKQNSVHEDEFERMHLQKHPSLKQQPTQN